MTFYEELTANDIETDHHESDLYFEASTKALDILEKHRATVGPPRFFLSAKPPHKLWAEVAFAYDPWWAVRVAKDKTNK